MPSISKPGIHSNGQTNRAAFYTEYAAIFGSCTNSSACSIETSQPLHYTFGSYRRTGCIVHHQPLRVRQHATGLMVKVALLLPSRDLLSSQWHRVTDKYGNMLEQQATENLKCAANEEAPKLKPNESVYAMTDGSILLSLSIKAKRKNQEQQ